MTIRKPMPYGTPASRPSNLDTLHSDVEIARHYVSSGNAKPCTVTKGGIAQSLGINGEMAHRDSQPDQQMTLVDIDLLQINYRTDNSTDSSLHLVVAGTLAVQHRTPVSTCLLLSNSGIFRGRDVLPRAHPNDGFMDVLEIDPKISFRQLAIAWRRSTTGSHLPHPQIRVSRSSEYQWSGRPSKMIADGTTYQGVVWLHCKVIADAMSIYF